MLLLFLLLQEALKNAQELIEQEEIEKKRKEKKKAKKKVSVCLNTVVVVSFPKNLKHLLSY